MSLTLCTYLWNHAVVDITKKKIRACCKTPSIQLTDDIINEYKENVFLNIPEIKQNRTIMLEGGNPSSCNTCWNLEKTGKFSYRDGPKQWHNYFDNLDYDDYSNSFHPNNLDIQLDNLCDLKCIYCNEEFSSQWQTEKQKYGELNTFIPINNDFSEFESLFFSWFASVKDNFERIAFLGGEPLISPRFYTYLDRIITTYNNEFPKKLEINVITNLNTNESYFSKFISMVEKYKHSIKFNINISMESANQQAEFIRFGISYDRFKNNFEKLASIQGITLSTITSVNLFSLSTLNEYIKFVTNLEKKYNINVILYPNLIVYPEYLTVDLLTKDIGKIFIKRILYVLVNTNHQNYIEFIHSLESKFNFDQLKNSQIHKDLIQELEKLSHRRNINFKEIFHEYKYLWE